MNCKSCGHELNSYGICPICGWQLPQSPGSPNLQNQNGYVPPYQQANPQNYQNYQNYNGYAQPYQQANWQNYQNYQNYQSYNGYAQPYQQANPQNSQNNAGNPKRKKIPWIIGMTACLLILIVGIVLILPKRPVKDLTNDNDKPDKPTEAQISTTEATTEVAPVANPRTKTIMIYMVGSDLESEYAAASSDIDEILNSGYDESSMHVLLYTGGCQRWHTSEILEDTNTTFIVEDGELKELTSKTASNMGDPANLTEFLTYAYTNYPAEQYDLILWNHGGGAFFGYGYDETTGDSLTLDELSKALAASPFHDDNKLGFIGFDACLMANIETAHILSPYADYMIASQEPEPGNGWCYDFFADIAAVQDVEEIGQIIVDSYMEETSAYLETIPFSYCTICLSVLDLSQVQACEAALDTLFAAANQDFNEATFSNFSSIRKNTKEIAASYSYTEGSYDVIDFGDYALRLRSMYPNEATALSNAISSMIVYSDANESHINGVSIYHPYYTKEYVSTLIPMYTTFHFAENYTSYLSRFAGMLTDTDAFDIAWEPDSLVPTLNEDSSFSISLQDAQVSNLQNAYFVIAKKEAGSDDIYDMVALSSAVSNDGSGIFTAEFDGQITYMQNTTTLENYELMYTVQEKTDTYTRYLLSAILYNDDIEGADSMYAYFVLEVSEEHPEGQLLGAYPIENYIQTEGNELFPERYEINIHDYKNVAFGYFSHQFTSNEDLTNFNQADWSDLMIHYNYFPIEEGFTPIRGSLLAGESYYGMFIFEDMQGNRHCSSLVQIQ